MIEVVRLMLLGVPWGEAMKMSPARRKAIEVAAGELRGGVFNWDRNRWEDRN